MWIITGVLLGAIFLATVVGFHAGPHAHVVMRLPTPRGHRLGPMSRVCCGDFAFIRRLKVDTQRATPAELHSLGFRETNV
jgi:hypothetical protein